MLSLWGDLGAIRLPARPGLAVVFATIGLLAACGDDDSARSSDGATDGGQESGPQEGDTEGSDNAGTGSPATTGDATGGGSDTDTGDDDSGSDGAIEDDCPLACGPTASCGFNGEQPQCVCNDPDQQWAGSQCIACVEVAGQDVSVDIPVVVDAVFRVTLDQAAFPNSPSEGGRIVLRSRDTLDEVELGPTGGGDLTATVVAGQYDVFYEYLRGGADVPLNESALLGEAEIVGAAPIELDVDRTLVQVHVTVNGATPPSSPTNLGRIVLVDPSTGDEVPLASTSLPDRTAWIVPGFYEVHYRWVRGADSVPKNADAVLMEVDLRSGEDVQSLDVEIPYIEFSGDILVNNAPAPASPNEFGVLTLVSDDDPDDRIDLGPTSGQNYSVKLISGGYTVFYSHRAGGSTVPVNTWGRVQTLTVDAPEIRIRSAIASGDITISGQPPPSDGANDGVLSLRSEDGDYVALGNTTAGMYSRRVIPSQYQVFYSQETAGGQVPANTNAAITDVVVDDAGTSTPVDIEMGPVSGTITLNKDVPPNSEYDDGRVYLRNRETGDSVLLGNTRMGTFSQAVVPGIYDVVYVVESAGADVPVNTEAIITEGIDVVAGDVLEVNIPVGRVTGAITLGGQEPQAAGAGVILQDVRTADEVFLGTLDDPQFDEALAQGRYLARYRGGEGSYAGPANRDAAFQCIDVVAVQ